MNNGELAFELRKLATDVEAREKTVTLPAGEPTLTEAMYELNNLYGGSASHVLELDIWDHKHVKELSVEWRSYNTKTSNSTTAPSLSLLIAKVKAKVELANAAAQIHGEEVALAEKVFGQSTEQPDPPF
jgi:hypothetical protein